MLENLKNKNIDIFSHNGLSVINCEIRGKQIKVTPEEIIRQKALKCLIEDMKVPKSNLKVEYHLGKKSKGIKLRADIIIFHNNTPILIIECKNENVFLGQNEFEQAEEYNEILNTNYLLTTNGKQIRFYQKKELKFERVDNTIKHFNELCSDLKLNALNIRSMAEQKAAFIELVRLKNFPHDQWLKDSGRLDSPETLTFAFLHYALFHFVDNNFPDNWNFKSSLTKFNRDLGLFERRITNAGGGQRIELQRAFELVDNRGDLRIFNFSHYTQAKRTETFEGVYQILACNLDKNKSHTVQIQLKKSIKVLSKSKVKLYHSGTISRVGSQELIDFIKTKCPHLIENDKIYLGEFSIERKIWNHEHDNIKDHIGRLIDYTICREEFKNLKGIKSI